MEHFKLDALLFTLIEGMKYSFKYLSQHSDLKKGRDVPFSAMKTFNDLLRAQINPQLISAQKTDYYIQCIVFKN